MNSASPDDLAQVIGNLLQERHQQMAVAESLTGGDLAAYLARAPEASQWLRGGVVAYQPEVKQSVLGVEPGPVVTKETAVQMADGVASLLGADLTVSVTGVGGPDPDEGKPAGTVWMAVHYGDGTETRLLQLEGDPAAVCHQTCEQALAFVLERIS
ncbi:MAG: CinA domain protein [Acidimicrobiia bacterium]|nr:CinA domain protein [Acidimicrobiia bacterium]